MQYSGMLTGNGTVHRQAHNTNCHKRLISHGINDGSHNSLLIELPRDPAIDQISSRSIGKQREGKDVILVDDKVTDEWSHCQTRKGQDVRNGVDVLTRERDFVKEFGFHLGGGVDHGAV